ncbi:MAG: 30S ribosomal protein S11 [Candidatus Parcubacteria bacterium]|nr:30S ribosomal protein S11 [Candidatus Parcubacteria bacterium]
MGKKHIIQKTEKELIEERAKVDAKVQKESEAKAPTRKIRDGRVYIFASYNNTIMTLTDASGNALGWLSAGSIGFRGTKKATPFAASKVAEALYQIASKIGIEKIEIKIKGIGSGRESAIRSLAARGLEITSIQDKTPIPHNGTKPPKVRRV